MSGAVIELGLALPEEPELPPPSRGRRRPVIPGWVVPVAVVVGTLVAVTAASPPRRWDPVLALGDANTVLRFGPDDTAYVTTHRLRSSRLQAYRPDRAGPLWTVNFPAGYPTPRLAGDPGLLTLTVYDVDPDGHGTGNAVQGRDARTGRVLWTRTGSGLLSIGPEVAVTTDREEAGGSIIGPGTGRIEGGGMIEAVDRRTGHTRWSRTVAPDTLVGREEMPGDQESKLVELALDGRLRLSDPSSGTVRRDLRLTLVGRPQNVYVTGGLVVVHQIVPDPGDIIGLTVAYDLTTGAELSRQDSARLTSLCGDRYLCVDEPGGLTTVTDVTSGVVRFQGRSEWHQLNGDRLIVSWKQDGPHAASTQVYDLRSGDRLRDYPGWSFAGADDRVTYLAQETSGRRLLVAMLDAHGKLSVVGRGDGWTGSASCTHGVRYFGCVGAAGVRIWRQPPATR